MYIQRYFDKHRQDKNRIKLLWAISRRAFGCLITLVLADTSRCGKRGPTWGKPSSFAVNSSFDFAWLLSRLALTNIRLNKAFSFGGKDLLEGIVIFHKTSVLQPANKSFLRNENLVASKLSQCRSRHVTTLLSRICHYDGILT